MHNSVITSLFSQLGITGITISLLVRRLSDFLMQVQSFALNIPNALRVRNYWVMIKIEASQ